MAQNHQKTCDLIDFKIIHPLGSFASDEKKTKTVIASM